MTKCKEKVELISNTTEFLEICGFENAGLSEKNQFMTANLTTCEKTKFTYNQQNHVLANNLTVCQTDMNHS